MKKNDLIIAYIYNKSVQADRELEQMLHNIRGRKSDEEDFLECIIALTKSRVIDEILLDLLKISGF